MRRTSLPTSISQDANEPARYAGWSLLTGVVAIAVVMIGIMLIALAQAPAAPHRAVIGGFVMCATGFLLLVIAWLGRRPPA